MNRLFVFAATLALLVGTSSAALRAQQGPSPDPEPSDPHAYVDPGMQFTAPPDAYLLGRHPLTPDQLGSDLQPVASWVLHPGKEDAHTITILMEAFNGPPGQWEAQFESQEHSSGGEGLLIKNKTPMQLLNGMPATFVEITSGEGFSSHKSYAVVWGDGARGVVLEEDTRLGDVGADQARAALRDATAVRYPIDQP